MSVSFVAEISSNHNQDLDRCLALIDRAAEVGCTAVKFQLFKIRELFAPEILAKSEPHRQREKWELPLKFLPELADHCRKAQIAFSCTPFYLDAVQELLPFVDFYKIASYELLWEDLLATCAQTGKPIVISTGMATIEEINRAVAVIGTAGCRDLTILHCISSYPTPAEECNLAAIQAMREQVTAPSPDTKISFGWSDHSVNPGVIYRAIHHWKAEMIEFHLDIDGRGWEFTDNHCWLPEEIKTVIETVRAGFTADGLNKKIPMPCEATDRNWRADPSDGLRPLVKTRKQWKEENETQ